MFAIIFICGSLEKPQKFRASHGMFSNISVTLRTCFLVSFQQITFSLGSFTDFQAFFPVVLKDFQQLVPLLVQTKVAKNFVTDFASNANYESLLAMEL